MLPLRSVGGASSERRSRRGSQATGDVTARSGASGASSRSGGVHSGRGGATAVTSADSALRDAALRAGDPDTSPAGSTHRSQRSRRSSQRSGGVASGRIRKSQPLSARSGAEAAVPLPATQRKSRGGSTTRREKLSRRSINSSGTRSARTSGSRASAGSGSARRERGAGDVNTSGPTSDGEGSSSSSSWEWEVVSGSPSGSEWETASDTDDDDDSTAGGGKEDRSVAPSPILIGTPSPITVVQQEGAAATSNTRVTAPVPLVGGAGGAAAGVIAVPGQKGTAAAGALALQQSETEKTHGTYELTKNPFLLLVRDPPLLLSERVHGNKRARQHDIGVGNAPPPDEFEIARLAREGDPRLAVQTDADTRRTGSATSRKLERSGTWRRQMSLPPEIAGVTTETAAAKSPPSSFTKFSASMRGKASAVMAASFRRGESDRSPERGLAKDLKASSPSSSIGKTFKGVGSFLGKAVASVTRSPTEKYEHDGSPKRAIGDDGSGDGSPKVSYAADGSPKVVYAADGSPKLAVAGDGSPKGFLGGFFGGSGSPKRLEDRGGISEATSSEKAQGSRPGVLQGLASSVKGAASLVKRSSSPSRKGDDDADGIDNASDDSGASGSQRKKGGSSWAGSLGSLLNKGSRKGKAASPPTSPSRRQPVGVRQAGKGLAAVRGASLTVPCVVRWEGEMMRGLPNGFGIFFILGRPAARLMCQAVDGEAHGLGVYLSDSGFKYEGQFEHNRPHGYGHVMYEHRELYWGEWRHGLRHGCGLSVSSGGVVTYALFDEGVEVPHPVCEGPGKSQAIALMASLHSSSDPMAEAKETAPTAMRRRKYQATFARQYGHRVDHRVYVPPVSAAKQHRLDVRTAVRGYCALLPRIRATQEAAIQARLEMQRIARRDKYRTLPHRAALSARHTLTLRVG